MGRSRNRRRPVTVQESAGRELRVALNNAELAEQRAYSGAQLRESINELESFITHDADWRRFVAIGQQEFTEPGLRQLRAICRLASISNPLLKRGLSLRSAYVHGQGVQITARANGKNGDAEQDVQSVISAFLDDDGNARAYTGPAARDRLERTLGTDGEFFVALVTRPMTGEVQVRVVNADEIVEIVSNPEDRTEPWFYRRAWIETRYNSEGQPQQTAMERLHPSVNYRPAARVRSIGAAEVAWDAPILHVDVNRPEHWLRGIPDTYAAINWARAYKTYLEQWATLMSALSKFAWRTTAGSAKQAQQMRTALTSSAPRSPEQMTQADIGQTMIVADGRTLEAIPKSGATIDSESGRPLAMMVAAAFDLPVTMLLSDPGQTGARATAKTLDRPTELSMGQRREVWTGADARILRYVIAEAVRAPRGPLKGTITRDRFRDRELVRLAGDTDDTIDIVWPIIDDANVKDVVASVVAANSSGVIPPEVILRLLLAALGVRDADTIVEALVGDDGTFHWPARPTTAPSQGQPPTDTAAPTQPNAGEAAAAATEALREADPGATPPDPDRDAHQAAVDAFLASWPQLAGPMVSSLADSATRVVRSGNVSALGGLGAPAASLRDVALSLRQSMTGLAEESARQVVAEAADQGVEITPATPDEGRIAQVAAATAALIAAGYAATAGQSALAAPTSAVVTAVKAALTDLGTAQRGLVGTQVAAALHAAQHEGRRATFAANPPTELVASEHHPDGNRCRPCKDADGTTYATLEEALADYPGLGGNIHCLGGNRCRGRLVGHWTTDGEGTP